MCVCVNSSPSPVFSALSGQVVRGGCNARNQETAARRYTPLRMIFSPLLRDPTPTFRSVTQCSNRGSPRTRASKNGQRRNSNAGREGREREAEGNIVVLPSWWSAARFRQKSIRKTLTRALSSLSSSLRETTTTTTTLRAHSIFPERCCFPRAISRAAFVPGEEGERE